MMLCPLQLQVELRTAQQSRVMVTVTGFEYESRSPQSPWVVQELSADRQTSCRRRRAARSVLWAAPKAAAGPGTLTAAAAAAAAGPGS